jgi:hypothetical protein
MIDRKRLYFFFHFSRCKDDFFQKDLLPATMFLQEPYTQNILQFFRGQSHMY